MNIDAKQTGVTEGITAHASTDVGAWRETGSKASAYERTRCAPIASAANTSAFVTVRRAANAATSLNGGATQSAGLGIPKRSHTVLVTDATSSMPRIISDSRGGSKGSRHPGRRRPSLRSALTHAHEVCWAPLATQLTWNLHLATADEQATLWEQPTTLLLEGLMSSSVRSSVPKLT